MIIVRREFVSKQGYHDKAKQLTMDYKAKFNPASSWRILTAYTGVGPALTIEEDYASVAEYEAEYAELQKTPEFQSWVQAWGSVITDGSFVTNIYRVIE